MKNTEHEHTRQRGTLRKQMCDFCGEPAVWDGPMRGRSSWAFACRKCEHMLSDTGKRKLPLQGDKNKGRAKQVRAYMQDLDTAIAECPCGREQEVEPDAESGYCMDCGMRLTFTSPLDSLMEGDIPEGFEL